MSLFWCCLFIVGELFAFYYPFGRCGLILLFASSVLMSLQVDKHYWLLGLISVFFGIVYGQVWSVVHQSDHLSKNFFGRPVLLQGVLIEIPVLQHGVYSSRVRIERIDNNIFHKRSFVRLFWRRKPLLVGASYCWLVRMQPWHELSNPFMMSPRVRALSRNMVARATVVSQHPAQLREKNPWSTWLLRLRTRHLHQQEAVISSEMLRPWVAGLVLGFSSLLPTSDWSLLRDTGTAHLMAISGLHVGMVAGVFIVMGNLLHACFPRLGLWLPRPLLSYWMGFIVAISYSALAGFSIPTRRCVIMLLYTVSCMTWRRRVNVSQAVATGLLAESLFSPASLLSSGFWLSYGAVLSIVVIQRSFGHWSRWRQWWGYHAGIWFTMLPLSMHFFGQISCHAFWVNMLAIPWVSFVILPLTLFADVLMFAGKSASHWWFQCVAWQISKFHHFLAWSNATVAAYDFPTPYVSLWRCLTALCLSWIVLFTPRWWIKAVSLAMVLLLLFWFASSHLPSGQARMTVLDVGQGLSVVIETSNHILVYDTGPKLGHFDAGKKVVVPFLHRSGYLSGHFFDHRSIDMVVVSHGDNDHAGGLPSILHDFRVRWLISSSARLQKQFGARPCHWRQSWSWDGVRFQVLWPKLGLPISGNNASCVLRVSAAGHAMILSGDVERRAEQLMLNDANIRRALRADWLLVAHHGSSTSSSSGWLDAVAPQVAVISSGFHNRFHFPHDSIMRRLHQRGITTYNTAFLGALQWRLTFAGFQQKINRFIFLRL